LDPEVRCKSSKTKSHQSEVSSAKANKRYVKFVLLSGVPNVVIYAHVSLCTTMCDDVSRCIVSCL
jgi:hypothetical protein